MSDLTCFFFHSGSVAASLASIPDKDAVIATFHDNRLGCLASGAVQNFVKFFFFGEMVRQVCTVVYMYQIVTCLMCVCVWPFK